MRTSHLTLGIAVVLAGPLACGPATPAVSPTPTATVAAAVATVLATPIYDLTPVAEPGDVIGLARWASPAAMVTTLSSCSGVPPQVFDGLTRLGLDEAVSAALRGQVDAKSLVSAIALDAPVDFIVAIDPASKKGQPFAALSIGLTSLDQAKGALEAKGALTEVAPGMWHSGKESKSPYCVVAASAGATPARLVCSQKQKDVVALAPYLTRTLPTVAPGKTDLHAEVRFAPLDARFGGQLRQQLRGLPVLAQTQATIGERSFDAAIVEAAVAIGDEVSALAGDLDTISLDVDVEASTCVTVAAALQMRAKSSWIANTMADRAERAGPPPAIFWRAPKDSDSAFFGRAADPTRFTSIVRTLRTLATGALAKEKIGSDADRKALAELIATPLSKDTTSVQASGHFDGAPTKLSTAPTPQQVADAVVNGYLGWHVTGFDEGPDAIAKMLKNFVGVYGRKALLDPLKKEMKGDARFLPTVKLVTAPAQLGKGALDVEIAFSITEEADDAPKEKGAKAAKKAKPEKVTFALHMLMMADGKNTWLAFGGRRDELVKRLMMVKTGAPDSGTLAARAGLEPLKSGKNMSGGFLTLTPLVKGAGALLATPGLPVATGDALNTLNSLPHKGETPIFLTSTVVAGSAPRAELSLNVTKGTIEDLGTIVMAGVRMANTLKP